MTTKFPLLLCQCVSRRLLSFVRDVKCHFTVPEGVNGGSRRPATWSVVGRKVRLSTGARSIWRHPHFEAQSYIQDANDDQDGNNAYNQDYNNYQAQDGSYYQAQDDGEAEEMVQIYLECAHADLGRHGRELNNYWNDGNQDYEQNYDN
jgi:hypothetical protein